MEAQNSLDYSICLVSRNSFAAANAVARAQGGSEFLSLFVFSFEMGRTLMYFKKKIDGEAYPTCRAYDDQHSGESSSSISTSTLSSTSYYVSSTRKSSTSSSPCVELTFIDEIQNIQHRSSPPLLRLPLTLHQQPYQLPLPTLIIQTLLPLVQY